MKHSWLGLILAALALSSLACGLTVNLPLNEVETGPTQVEPVEVSYPISNAEQDVELSLSFGAGELRLEPGAVDLLAQGNAIYNVADLKPVVRAQGSTVILESGDLEINALPSFGDDFINRWELRLGDRPMRLSITAGAYKADCELGGLAIRALRISDGAAQVELNFSQPNRAVMDTLTYETGASEVTLRGLANANFESLVFKAGSGSYELDFSGVLTRAADVTIDAGLSSLTIIVPDGTPARVFVDASLADVDISGAWEQSGDAYTLPGDGPRLNINVNIGAGSLDLRTD